MQLTNEEKGYIWLDSFPLKSKEKFALLNEAGGAVPLLKNFERVCPAAIKNKNFGVYNNMAKSLADGGAYFQSLVASYEREEIIPIAQPSEYYPAALKSDEAAPLVLYAKGNIRLLKTPAFAVVGSRLTPDPVMETGEAIAKELSERFTVLTGTAEGGDSAAIKGALQGSGNVICLLAGGFRSVNKGNLPLLKKVKARGLLLSAHLSSEPIRAFSYSERNRLLARLACGVLVLSAGEKSGALITANYAERFQKPVFALPYPPLSAAGAGCNALIKNGAHLTETALDVFSKTGVSAPTLSSREEAEPRPAFTEAETAVLRVLEIETELPLEKLAAKLGEPAFKLNGVITSLEVKGAALRTGGNRVAIRKRKKS